MFEELLEKTALALDSARIPYMVIGGQAVLLYGEPRLTRDIDITLGVGVEQAETVISLALDLRPLPEDVREFVGRTFVLPCLDEGSTDTRASRRKRTDRVAAVGSERKGFGNEG